jgi:HK97 family phage portal protein
MSLANRLFFPESRTSVQVANPRDPILAQWFGASANTSSGMSVTPDQAMRFVAVFAAVRILAESMASLPIGVYQYLPNGGKKPASEHPLHPILHDQPNRWQTSFEFREMMTGHLALRGNAYAEIISSGGKAVAELIPLHPDRVHPFRSPDGSIAYEYTDKNGKPRIVLQDEMFHLRGFSSDGIIGLSPIEMARESIGLGMAADEFGASYFGNGTVVSGVLEHPKSLSDEAYKRLRESWSERHAGTKNSHKPAILEDGMKWQAIGVKPEEAQFLETRKFQVTEIARLYRIPPHLLGDMEKSTTWGTGLEQLNIGFVQYTLMPYMIRWEQAAKRDLFTKESKKKYFIKHKVDGLLRGDSTARKEYYTGLFGIGALSINDILELEDRNPVEGGDQRFVPLNMVPLSRANEIGQNNGSVNGQRAEAILVHEVERIAIKEVRAVGKAIQRLGIGDELNEWIEGFYRNHIEFVRDVLAVDNDVAVTYTETTAEELKEVIMSKDPESINQWSDRRIEDLRRLAFGL